MVDTHLAIDMEMERDIFCLVVRGVLKINEFSVIPVLYEIEMHCNSNYGCMTIEFYRLVTFLH